MGWFSDEASQRERSGGLASTSGIFGGLSMFRPQVRRPVTFVHLPQLRPVQRAQFSENASSFELKKAKIPVDVPSNAQRFAQQVAREVQFATGVVTLVVKKQAEQTWQNVASIAQLRPRRREEQRVQTETHAPVHSATSLLLRAEALQTSGDLKGAIELLESASAIEPNNASVLCFLSKQWTDHSFLPGITHDQIIQVNDRAIMHAMAAQKADPTLSLAYCAESICKGRKAFFESGPKKKLQLAKEAQEAAYRAVDLNHADDIAHHLIGRWNVGMAGLNFLVKACIKYVFGTDFRSGTMEDALLCYERAAALRPDRVIHRVELARCYEHFGRRDEAVAELKACLHLPLEDINARQMLEEGVQILHGFDPSHVPTDRTPAYIKTSADALRSVWADFSSALEDESLMTSAAAPPMLTAPVACAA